LRVGYAYRALPWAGPFAVVLGILLVRNAWLFSTPVYEDADMGAYSIQIEQARRFALLVGNYSREKFNHPGPAFLYVQAWGEDLFYAMLRVVPAAWNGEVVGLYLLSSFFAACVVVVGFRWGGGRSGLAMLAAVGLFGALHPSIFASDWMPYEYVPAYLAFVVSAASVAGGRSRDSWIAALSGWFLIHGHACFLLFVPLISLGVVAVRLLPHVRRRAWPRVERRVWVPVAVISGLFALPIVLELVLHWPGDFGKYFDYSDSAQSGGHSVPQVVEYVLWFWWPRAGAWAVVGLLVLAAGGAVWRMPSGPVRRFCLALLGVNALSTVAFVAYTATGIDEVNQYYIGYFYWSAPVLVALVLLLAGTEWLAARSGSGWAGARVASGVAVALALAGCAAFAAAPLSRLSTAHADPGDPAATGPIADPSLPAGVARIGALAGGRYAVISFPQDAWPAITGILVQAERTGVPACVADPKWEFMMTSQFICTRKETRDGLRFRVWAPGSVPRGVPVLFRLRRGVVAYYTS
jgi:hypothetical protein